MRQIGDYVIYRKEVCKVKEIKEKYVIKIIIPFI